VGRLKSFAANAVRAPTLRALDDARARIADVAHTTPLLWSEVLSEQCGYFVHLKAENLQRTGSFKIRGAYNCLASLAPRDRAAGVVAASAGNHAQAVAWSARALRIDATIFVPEAASTTKIEATKRHGATVIAAGETLDESIEAALVHAERTNAVFVPPFEDIRVIAGQGTIGLEILEQLPDVATVVVPVGGGGLAAGIGIAIKSSRSDIRIVGVQAEGCSPLAGSSDYRGTIADGIAVKRPGELTSRILADVVDEFVTVSDAEIGQAIRLLLAREKLLVEGAGAVATAAIMAGKLGGDGVTVALLSGGNIDDSLLLAVMQKPEPEQEPEQPGLLTSAAL
jgi:threonine dehydratase